MKVDKTHINSTSTKSMYPPSCYDENVCLKPSFALWATIAFVLRPFVVFIASITNKADRIGILNMFYPDKNWAFYHAIASLPTLLVVIAWLKRNPGAPSWVRAVWFKGQWLIGGSLFLNASFILGAASLRNFRFSSLDIVQLGICFLLLYYVFRSRRITDTFRDFPLIEHTIKSEASK